MYLLYSIIFALSIFGQVVDAETGEPIEGVHVVMEEGYFLENGTPYSVYYSDFADVTDERGRFYISGWYPRPYKVVVSFSHVSYDTLRTAFIVENVSSEKTVELQPKIHNMGTVNVTLDAIRDVNTSVSLLDEREIEKLDYGQDPYVTLETLPSFTTFSDNGVYGGYTYTRLRGLDQTRINVTLNGVPLNEPEDQGAYFSNFPGFFEAVQSVQVQRGVGTSKSGAANYVGSINFETHSPLRGNAFEINTGLGSFDTRHVNIESNVSNNKVGGYITGSYLTTDGYRDHSGHSGYSVFGSAAYLMEDRFVQITGFAGMSNNDMAYLAASKEDLENNPRINYLSTEEDDQFHQQHIQFMLSENMDEYHDISLTQTVYYTHLSGNYDVLLDDMWNFNLTSHWVGYLNSVSYSAPQFNIKAGLSAYWYKRNHFLRILPSDLHEYHNAGVKNNLSAYVKATYEINNNLSVTGDTQFRTVSFEYLPDSNFDYSVGLIRWYFVNPKISLNYEINDNLDTYLFVGKTSREPTRNDLFGGFDNVDNDVAVTYPEILDLETVSPETVYDYEAGINRTSASYSTSLNLFYMDFRNEIAPIGELSYIGLPLRKNVNSSYRRGIEASVGYRLTEKLSLNVNATYMDAEISSYTDDNTGITYENVEPLLTPTIITNQSVSYDLTRFSTLTLRNRYVGKSYLDNTQNDNLTLPSYYRLDLISEVDISYTKLVIRINNLTDNRIYTNGYVGLDETGDETPYYFIQAPINLFVSFNLAI